jgi:hypothetical protein
MASWLKVMWFILKVQLPEDKRIKRFAPEKAYFSFGGWHRYRKQQFSNF